MFGKIKNLYQKIPKKYLVIGGVILVLVLYFAFRGGSQAGEVLTAERTKVAEEVVVIGKTKARSSVELGFDKTGRVARVYKNVGDEVMQGAVIAELESGDTSADLIKARAALDEEQVKLSEIKKSTPLEAKNAISALQTSVRDAYAVADDAVRNKTDQFFKNPTDQNPKFEVSFTDGSYVHYFKVDNDLAIDLNYRRKNIESMLRSWQSDLSKLDSGNAQSLSEESVRNLTEVATFLNKVALAVNSFTAADFNYETTVSGYKSTVNTARTNINTALQSLITAKDKLALAPQASAGSDYDAILTQEARVSQAQAAVLAIESTLGKTQIRAPFAGTITRQDAKPGEVASANTQLVALISQSDMNIEANVSEVNIGKVQVGNKVKVEFDAFPGETFEGEVAYVEPAETIVDDVVNYKVRVEVKNDNDQAKKVFKSGLTSNLTIETRSVDQVVAIPAYAVFEKEGKSFVNKTVGESTVEVPVEVGLRGSDGLIEIKSGLNPGDTVLFVK